MKIKMLYFMRSQISFLWNVCLRKDTAAEFTLLYKKNVTASSIKKQMKLIFICILLITMIIPVGCKKTVDKVQSEFSKRDNIIYKAQLTKSEEGLIKALGGEKYLIFDYSLKKDEYRYQEFWIDYYENGKKQKEFFRWKRLVNDLGKECNRILIGLENNEKEEKFLFSCIRDNIAGKSIYLRGNNKNKELISTWVQAEKLDISEGKDLALAIVAFKQGNSINSICNDFFYNESREMNELLENDYVYIFRCKFTK